MNNSEKSVFITGANGGMGLRTTKLLAQNHDYIVMGGRNDKRIQEARNEVLSEPKTKSGISILAQSGFDMNDPESIEMAVASLPKERGFDIVFLQAGGATFTDDYSFTKYKGKQMERTVFQNSFGALITLWNLKKHGLVNKGARIVFAGGEGARGIPGMIVKPEFDGPENLRRYLLNASSNGKKYNSLNAIGISKLTSAWLTIKLAELDGDENEYVWFSPGLTAGTNGLADLGPVKKWIMENIGFGLMKVLGKAQNPQKGAEKYIESLEGRIGKNGDIIGAPEGGALGKFTDQKPMNAAITDKSLIDEFWKITHEIYSFN